MPEPPGLLGRRQRRVREQCVERVPLLLLDGADHLGEQAVAGAEVVDQHPVAGTECRGEGAQAVVADAVRGEVLDRGRQQSLAWGHPVFSDRAFSPAPSMAR